MAPLIIAETSASDRLLQHKMRHAIKSIISNLPWENHMVGTENDTRRANGSNQTHYTYDEFCRDLDLSDIYSQRILELLVHETLSRKSQRRYVGENPDDECLYEMQVEELNGVAWQAFE